MCLSKAYVDSGDGRKLLLEEVASLEIENGKLLLTTLFGEEKEIRANIKEIDFLNHNIIVEELE